MSDNSHPFVEVYGHGGDVETAAQRFGGDAAAYLDYSANINPLGPPQEVMHALQDAMKAIIRYPDPGHRGFKRRLSDKLGIGEEQLLAGNGAAECMALLLLGLKPQTVGVVEPCFSEYRQLAEQFGCKVRTVYGREDRDWRADKAQIAELLSATDLVILGQPNNPNGVQYELADIRELAGAAERCGAWLVLDEAFIDFIPARQRQTLLPELANYPRTIIIRSMTKFYAIPGLRLGYACAHPEVIRAMAGKQVTWSVNGLALLAGEACLASGRDFEQQTLALIDTERSRLTDGLRALRFRVSPGEANYVLAELPEPWNAERFQREMGRCGILVRSCAMYPGLRAGHIRLAVKDAAANQRLLHAIAEVLAKQPGTWT
ncbi:threonine-phosphate decarboxylase CobD [Paenibacillus cisolokensis]|uniref:threonine-phosphate decarboxylase CobD n=1 Tax=Paenibacillus cisolokensis TaxID=1658519 RepID=UPI003D290417